jgi:succinate-semialdehyde dehydrogenase / glutarate-semialdehyde dehydrogenase
MTNYPDLQLFIGGEWKSADGQPVLNPADESVIGVVPHATRADLDAALAAAESGFQKWRRTSPAKRAEIILKAAALVRERVEEMAVAMTLEQGKPIAQSRLEILRGCDIIEWDATEGRRIYGRVIPSEPGMRHTVLRQPIGVVAAFSPWNFPMSSPARKVGAPSRPAAPSSSRPRKKRRRARCSSRTLSMTRACRRECSISCSAHRRRFPSI